MKIPLLADGRVDVDALAEQVDWDNLSAFESLLLTFLDIDWEGISRELKENRELAKLSWGENETLLGVASLEGQFEVVKLLVESGAKVQNISKSETPIFGAVWSGNSEIVEYLIKKGVGESIDYGCVHGWTPLHLAAREGYVDIVQILKNAGADVNSVDAEEATPLDLAASRYRLDVVNLLIKNGAKCLKPETQKFLASSEE